MEFFFTFVSILTRFCSLVQWQEHQPHEQQQCGECASICCHQTDWQGWSEHRQLDEGAKAFERWRSKWGCNSGRGNWSQMQPAKMKWSARQGGH